MITWTYDGDATIAAMLEYDYRPDGTIESRSRHTETFRDDGLIIASTDGEMDGTVYATTEFTYDGTELARWVIVAADQHVIADDRWTWRRGRPVRVESLTGSQPRFQEIDWSCR